MHIKKLTIAVLGAMLGASSAGVYADNRFDTQGGALEGLGSFGSGSVTVHHNLLSAEREELIGLIKDLEGTLVSEIDRLETELDLTRDALAGDVAELHAKTDVVQVAADNAQASADEALRQAETLYQQLADVEQEVVATQLAVQQAQRAADDAQGTADQARAEAALAQASANAADALARLARNEAAAAQNTANSASTAAGAAQATANTARTEASKAQNTANTARTEASNAQSTADTAAALARQGIQDALAAYRHAEKAQQLANAARNKADMAYSLAQEAYAIGVPTGAYAYFHQTSCPTGWVHANGSNGTVDLRGEFIRTWDAGRGVDSGRGARSSQGDQLEKHNHFLPTSDSDYGTTWTIPDNLWTKVRGNTAPVDNEVATTWGDSGNKGSFGLETRPRNVALLACKKN